MEHLAIALAMIDFSLEFPQTRYSLPNVRCRPVLILRSLDTGTERYETHIVGLPSMNSGVCGYILNLRQRPRTSTRITSLLCLHPHAYGIIHGTPTRSRSSLLRHRNLLIKRQDVRERSDRRDREGVNLRMRPRILMIG